MDDDGSADHIAGLNAMPSLEEASGHIEGPPRRDDEGRFYQVLPIGCIRLLRILPGRPQDVIRCEMRHSTLDTELDYTALSYTWGRGPDNDRIVVNGHEMRIRKNLGRFLSSARQTLSKQFEWIWIDALCINQKDNRERMQQVELMAQIYRLATSVLIWLGPAYGGSEKALDCFNRQAFRISKGKSRNISSGDEASTGIAALCHRPYWRRLWILQEIVLAKRKWLVCGDRISPWEPFSKALLGLPKHNRGVTFAQTTGDRLRGEFEMCLMKSPAMAMVELAQQQSDNQTLYDLLHDTTLLQCSEPRDKIYGLLGIIKQGDDGIVPDYDVEVVILLNAVLREYHKMNPPPNLKTVIDQCHALEELFDLDQSAMFKTENQSNQGQNDPAVPETDHQLDGDADSSVGHRDAPGSDTDPAHHFEDDPNYDTESSGSGANYVFTPRRESSPSIVNDHTSAGRAVRYHFGPRDMPITWWWLSSHGHTTLEDIFWCEFKPDLLPFYYEAAGRGDLAALQILFDRAKFDVHFKKNPRKEQPLERAVRNRQCDAVRLMLRNGVKPIAVATKQGRWLASTALTYAVILGETTIVRLLIEAGANVHDESLRKGSPLRYAAKYGRLDIARLLLDHGALPDDDEPDGYVSHHSSPLSVAAELGHIEIVRLLLDRGAQLNARRDRGNYPLTWAARRGDAALFKLLLEKGADVLAGFENYFDGISYDTPLQIARERSDTEIEALILAHLEAHPELETLRKEDLAQHWSRGQIEPW
jgi:ankyrin repeat protein